MAFSKRQFLISDHVCEVEMRNSFRETVFACLVLLTLCGCSSYKAQPLVPAEIIAHVEQNRRMLAQIDQTGGSAPKPPTFTFAQAAQWMSERSPDLQEIRAGYETALGLAKVETPFPNPVVEVGPQIGSNLESGANHRIQPFVSVGFTIPLSGRIGRQDDLHHQLADRAYVETLAKHRELYLALRKVYSQLTLTQSKLASQRKIQELTEQGFQLTQKLVKAGAATALDVGLMELEFTRAQMEFLNLQADLARVEQQLSYLTGVHADLFVLPEESSLPPLEESLPDRAKLKDLLIANHPRLAVICSDYEVAESELRLEIAKQYPDLQFGSSYEEDVGETKRIFGLTLGIALPVFDRNQQGVVIAEKRREEIRIRYESEANRALAELDRAYKAFEIAAKKLALLTQTVLPKSKTTLDLAFKSLQAGGIDSLKYLEIERTHSHALIDAVQAELEIRTAWIELEQAVGYPLVLFPGESADLFPALPTNTGKSSEDPIQDNKQ